MYKPITRNFIIRPTARTIHRIGKDSILVIFISVERQTTQLKEITNSLVIFISKS